MRKVQAWPQSNESEIHKPLWKFFKFSKWHYFWWSGHILYWQEFLEGTSLSLCTAVPWAQILEAGFTVIITFLTESSQNKSVWMQASSSALTIELILRTKVLMCSQCGAHWCPISPAWSHAEESTIGRTHLITQLSNGLVPSHPTESHNESSSLSADPQSPWRWWAQWDTIIIRMRTALFIQRHAHVGLGLAYRPVCVHVYSLSCLLTPKPGRPIFFPLSFSQSCPGLIQPAQTCQPSLSFNSHVIHTK